MAKRSTLADDIATYVKTFPSVGRVMSMVKVGGGRPMIKLTPNGTQVKITIKEPGHPRIVLDVDTTSPTSVVAEVRGYLERRKIGITLVQ